MKWYLGLYWYKVSYMARIDAVYIQRTLHIKTLLLIHYILVLYRWVFLNHPGSSATLPPVASVTSVGVMVMACSGGARAFVLLFPCFPTAESMRSRLPSLPAHHREFRTVALFFRFWIKAPRIKRRSSFPGSQVKKNLGISAGYIRYNSKWETAVHLQEWECETDTA